MNISYAEANPLADETCKVCLDFQDEFFTLEHNSGYHRFYECKRHFQMICTDCQRYEDLHNNHKIEKEKHENVSHKSFKIK